MENKPNVSVSKAAEVVSEPIEPDAPSHAAQQRQRASQLAQAIRVELQKAVIGQDSVMWQ
jgi:MoxR-like ATPase